LTKTISPFVIPGPEPEFHIASPSGPDRGLICVGAALKAAPTVPAFDQPAASMLYSDLHLFDYSLTSQSRYRG